MSTDLAGRNDDGTRGPSSGGSGPRVRGILETALYVADPARSAEFYRRLFGFPVLLESERLVALDVSGTSVLLLFKAGSTAEPFPTPGGIIPGHSGSGQTHFAFAVAAGDLPGWRRRLAVERVPIESEVTWPGGATSLYFRDPDGHLAELITEGFWRTY
jgi:catechol 2,3-dioxygenase-like lactoylglutathione lyase family enzyme